MTAPTPTPTPSTPAPTRIFLLDDHEIVRRGIADLLSFEDDMVVVGEAGTIAEALEVVPACRPDVALLDARLPDGSGLELCRDIRSADPSVRCVMLTSYDDSEAVFAAVLAGASGYLLKEIGAMNLAQALRDVAAGKPLLDPRFVQRVLHTLRGGPGQNAPLGELTQRERELLDLVADGLTNSEIAARTGLSERTVKAYVSGLIAKFVSPSLSPLLPHSR